MSEIVRDMLHAFGDAGGHAGDSYTILLPVEGCFLARGPTGRPSLLIPIAGDGTAPGRAFEGVTLDFRPRVRFELPDRRWEAPAAALECVDEALLHTFCVLCADMAAKLLGGGLPTARAVLDALWEWENLLRAQSRLGDGDELGLWGELWFLGSLTDLETGLKAWRGPENFAVDFLAGGIGLECKTTKTRLRHYVSHDQVATERDFPVYVISLWAGADPASGRSLPELVAEIDGRITDVTTWERDLLKRGYRRSAASQYTARYALLDAPSVFRDRDVPRVRAVDPGVRQLRYIVELQSDTAIDAAEWQRTLTSFITGRS